MSDLLERLVARELGEAATVEPVVGTRFGAEPTLLAERSPDESERAESVDETLPGTGGKEEPAGEGGLDAD